MKWVTVISCLFLISFAESKYLPRKYRDVGKIFELSTFTFNSISHVVCMQLPSTFSCRLIQSLLGFQYKFFLKAQTFWKLFQMTTIHSNIVWARDFPYEVCELDKRLYHIQLSSANTATMQPWDKWTNISLVWEGLLDCPPPYLRVPCMSYWHIDVGKLDRIGPILASAVQS